MALLLTRFPTIATVRQNETRVAVLSTSHKVE